MKVIRKRMDTKEPRAPLFFLREEVIKRKCHSASRRGLLQ